MSFLNRISKKKLQAPPVAAIGLDGVSATTVMHLARNGHMPGLLRLMDQGAAGAMGSTLPAAPSVAWTTLLTGVNPGRHGIFGTMHRRRQSYGVYFPNAAQVQCPTLLDLLSRAEKKIVAVNVPHTYPAASINGILISGPVALDLARAVYPPTFTSALRAMDYRIDADYQNPPKTQAALFETLFSALGKRRELLLNLLEKTTWDLFLGVLTGPGLLLRFLADACFDERHSAHPACMQYFRAVDTLIGEIDDRLSEGAALMIFSAYGSAPAHKRFYLNAWLQKQGLLAFQNDVPLHFDDLDPARTAAFALDHGGIYVNTEGRMPRGSVRAGAEHEELLDRMITNLLAIRDEASGGAVISRAYRREALYTGPQTEMAPDVVLRAAPGFVLKSDIGHVGTQVAVPATVVPSDSGGFFYMRDLRDLPANAHISAIAPTILKLLQLSPPAFLEAESFV